MNFGEKIKDFTTEYKDLALGLGYSLNYVIGEWVFQSKIGSETIDKLNKALPEAISNTVSFDPLRYQYSTFFGSSAIAFFCYYGMCSANIISFEDSDKASKAKALLVAAPLLVAKELRDYNATGSADWKDCIAVGLGLAMFYFGNEICTIIQDTWSSIFEKKAGQETQI
jgi:hypothetical protein